ncbi:chromosome segregation protein SMC [Candidatus Woesearchaeota archaeon]|nr:chromosome segregation protein SMC [Candidatus Woesearchaeota archaeon]
MTTKRGKMTHITSLILDGFKSFGKRTELLFGEKFNCILGPNGGGKSNILDALCFVLGKSGSKSLRAEKSANLIYNGGKSKKPANKAEVSIIFDNKEKNFPMPDSEIKISRIVTQKGTSTYKINQQVRTRQEILELLSKSNINPDGYNIILQGDIIQLVEMSPIERRQIIEQIAGIGVYEERKQKALGELSRVDEKINEADIVLKERESYVKELKKDRDHALKYKELKDNIAKYKATYITHQKNKKENEKKIIDEKSSKHKEVISKHDESLKKIREEIFERKKRITEISKNIEEQGDANHKKLQKELEALKISMATNTNDLQSKKTNISKLKQEEENIKKELEKLKEKNEELEKQREEYNELLSHHESQIKELERKIVELKKKHNLDAEGTISTEIEELDKTIEATDEQARQARERQQEIFREKDKIEFQLGTIDQQLAKVKELEEQNKEELKKLKQKKEEFKKAVIELNTLLNKDADNAARLSRLRKEQQELTEDLSGLEAQNRTAQEHITSNIAVTKILENKESLGEVYGTLSQLGTTEDEYSTALEMAAGKHLNSIVVKDDAMAVRCIKYLKEQKLGVATFLPLSKLLVHSDPEAKKMSTAKGVKGIASALVQYDPQYKKAFEYVFGNTLIVDSIDTARRIGIGPIKMATLDGDMAEKGGVMSGGFRTRKKTGSFSNTTLTKKLSEVREGLSNIESTISQLTEQRKKDEESITRLREFKATLEGDIIKDERSMHLDTTDLESSNEYKEQLKQQLKNAEQELRKVQESITNFNKTLLEKKTRRQELRDKLSTLRNPRALAEINTYEEKRKEELEKKLSTQAKLSQISAQIDEFLNPEVEKINRQRQKIQEENLTTESEWKELEKSVSQQQRDLAKKEKEQEKFQERFKELFNESHKLNDEINVRETKTYEFEEKSKREELSLNTLSIEIARLNAELAAISAELEQYAGAEIDLTKSEESLKKEISAFERMIVSIGSVNLKALDVYDAAEKEYKTLHEKKEILSREKEDVLKLMNEIETTKKEIFMKAFTSVQEHFIRIFTQLTHKGQQAHLELESPETIFDQGMNINVKLTGEKFLDLRSLSGGEKTLTALAFLFAIQEHEPATFYVLDEVDAALDKHNSKKLAELVRNYCNKAQYIVISHNDAVITEADNLYGVSVDEHGVSNVVSMKL